MNLQNWPYVYLWIQIGFIIYMQPYVLHESTKSTICVFMDTNLVYLQHAAVCPTWIYKIHHMCRNGYLFGLSSACCRVSSMNLKNQPYMYLYKFGLSSTCSRMSYMNLRNQPYVYLWILLWFIFNMLPYVLHESTKFTICVCMDTNLVYPQHAAVCPTWIYEIEHMYMYGY